MPSIWLFILGILEMSAAETALQQQTCILQKAAISTIEHSKNSLQPGVLDAPVSQLPPCAAQWPIFDPNEPFIGTQRNPVTKLPGDFTDFWDTAAKQELSGIGLFTFPGVNFAICLIPKVGSSMWSDVLLKIMTQNASASGKTLWEKYSRQAKGSVAARKSVFSNPDATRVVFVREPLSRFASAVLDKCLSEEPSSTMCPMLEAVEPGKPFTMRTAVDWMLQANLTTLDAHWMPQSFFCELRERGSEYTVLGYYSQETFGQDSACAMEIAGLSEFNTKGLVGNGEPFWTDSDTSSGKAPNGFHVNNTIAENELLQKLFAPGAARALIWKLIDDYVTFHIPLEPGWLAGATGEYYETVFYGPRT